MYLFREICHFSRLTEPCQVACPWVWITLWSRSYPLGPTLNDLEKSKNSGIWLMSPGGAPSDLMMWVKSLSCVWLFATTWTVAHQATLSVGILQARILEWVAMPSSREFPNPGIEPRSPSLQVDSLPSGPPGKHKNSGVGSLPILQGIFPT